MGETWNGRCVSEHSSHSKNSPPVTRHSWVFAQEQRPRPPLSSATGEASIANSCYHHTHEILSPPVWPMRVEIASSNSLWKKIITAAGQKQRWVAKSFFLHTYYITVWFFSSHGPKTQQHSKCPRWPAGIYYLLQSQEVHTKSSPGKQAMFYPPHDPLSSSSVKHFCHQRPGWLMFSEVGDELRGTSFQRKLISTERLWLLELCFKKAVLYCSVS